MNIPLLNKILKKGKKEEEDYEIQGAAGVTLQDIIAPSSIEIKQNYLKLGETFCRSFFVFSYPRYLSTGWLSPAININHILDISLHIHPVSTGAILRKLRKKLTETQAEILEREDKGLIRDPVLEAAHQDIEDLRDKLQTARERMFRLGVYITIYAQTRKDLEKIENRLRSIFESRLIYLKPCLLRQKEGFDSTAPYGMDKILSHTPMNTAPMSSIFPFVSPDLSANEGILYGVNQHNESLVLFDRFTLPNANMVVFASSGAGKSLHRNEKVLCKTNNRISLRKIGPLVDNILQKQGIDFRDKELEGKTLPGLKVWTFDKNMKGKWGKVKIAARKKAPQTFYKFRTQSGREITTTGDHNLVTLQKGRIALRKGSEVRKGEYVPLPKRIAVSKKCREQAAQYLLKQFRRGGKSNNNIIIIDTQSQEVASKTSYSLYFLGIIARIQRTKKRDGWRLTISGPTDIRKFTKIINPAPNKIRCGIKTKTTSDEVACVHSGLTQIIGLGNPVLSIIANQERLSTLCPVENSPANKTEPAKGIEPLERGLPSPALRLAAGSVNQSITYFEYPHNSMSLLYRNAMAQEDDSDLFWDPIVEIEKMENKTEEYVYDLTCENGVFLAGEGGMFVHNSYFCKLEILRYLMQGVDAIIIDPENEYKALAEAVGGGYANISLSSDNHLNPFDLPQPREGENPANVLRSNVINLVGLMRIMLGGLTPQEDSLVDKALTETYRAKDITEDSDPATWPDKIPLLSDFEVVLQGMEGTESLVDRLQRFTSGSYEQFFNHQTSVELGKRLTVFGVRDMEDELRPMALYIILRFIWNQARSEMKKRILLIDEAWWIMKSEDGASFLFGIVKRGRKYWLGVSTITQDVDDFMKSDYGKPIITNASLQFLLKQSPASIETVQEAFNLTEEEKYLLLECNVGEGVFIAGKKRVALKVVASYAEDQIITTSPEEVRKAKKAKQRLKGK